MNTEKKSFHKSCFACGTENLHGLKMRFIEEDDYSVCEVTVPSRFQSYDGVVHGGIIATMLDAAMVHSLKKQCYGNPLTCRLEVKYLKSVNPQKELIIKSKTIGKRGRVMLASAEVYCTDECYAKANGAFIVLDNLN